MTRFSLLLGQFVSLLFVVVLFATMGCSSESPDGAGGGGAGGIEGTGGAGGSATRTAVETCQAWCRNEGNGPSCCFQVKLPPPFDDFIEENDCRADCYDLCEETVAETACLEEYVAVRECQIQLACDDFFEECQALDGRLVGCSLRADAEESGLCAVAASACSITEAECLSTFVEAGSPDCAFGWEEYVLCLENGFSTCEECVEFSQPFDQECNWPSGAGEAIPFVPQSCDTFTLPPAACDDPCLSGSDTECGIGTYCEAEVCEANCIAHADCARGDACTDRGRCLPTIFGNPLECSGLDDPPSGCGASCPSGNTSECPGGTFCNFEICDAECGFDAQCPIDEQCRNDGTCGLPECSEEEFPTGATEASETLICSLEQAVGVALDVFFSVNFAGNATGSVQAGMSNQYELFTQLVISADTVNLLRNFTDSIDIPGIESLVESSMGSSDTKQAEIMLTEVPCAVRLELNTEKAVTLPSIVDSWLLDQGDTQKLLLPTVTIELEVPGVGVIPLTTAGDDPPCAWMVSPPELTFVAEL